MKQAQSNMRTVKQKSSNFTIISNDILRDKNLSLKARGLLCFMLHLPEDWVFTEKGLATVTGEGIRTIKSGLAELMDAKYLYRFQCKHQNGKFGNCIYYLFEEPTEMQIQNKNVVRTPKDSKQDDSKVDSTPNATYNIDKSHPDFDYLNGGWMLED